MPTAKKTTAKKTTAKKTTAKKASTKKTTAKKTTAAKAKRTARRKERREKVRRLGRVIKAALEQASKELPGASQEQRRQYVVAALNKKIDIGPLNEEQEEVLLGLLVDVVADLVVTTDNRGGLQRGAMATFLKLKEMKDGNG